MLQTTFVSDACEQCWDVTNYIRIRSMWAMLRCYKQHLNQKHVSNVEMLQTTFGSDACEQCWDVTNYIRIRSMWAMLRCYKQHLNQTHVSNVEMLQTTFGSEALKVISQWAFQWKMNFNPDLNKQATELLFSCKKYSPNYPSLFFNESAVPKVKE